MRTPNVYGAGFDRLAERRGDAAWVSERLRDPATVVTPFFEGRPLVRDAEDGLRLAGLPAVGFDPSSLVLVGRTNGVVRFASRAEGDAVDVEGARYADPREIGGVLPAEEASAAAMTRGLFLWHDSHRHCGRCGVETRPEQAGHVLRCDACGTSHHPRIEPSVITLVTDGGDRCILGRSRRHPPGMHSCFAGFVEPGESLENAVAREVFEEVGVEVNEVRYHSSQPWPFPASLMLGFSARATTDEIRIDNVEIREARWFTRDELLASPEDETLRLPRRDSIARRMVEDWLRGD